jgi:hypothetical protein
MWQPEWCLRLLLVGLCRLLLEQQALRLRLLLLLLQRDMLLQP